MATSLAEVAKAALLVPNMDQAMVDGVILKAHLDASEGIDLGYAQWEGWTIDEVPCDSYQADITKALRRVYRAAHDEA